MKILLVGEYSRLHNSLKEGLLKLGHEVLLIGSGDGFKKYPVDILIDPKIFDNTFMHPIVKLCDKLFNINLIEFENGLRFKKVIKNLKGFDIVQLVNEQSMRTTPNQEQKLIHILKSQNEKLIFLSCGTDYTSVKFASESKLKYSIFSTIQEQKSTKKKHQFVKYLSAANKKLSEYLFTESSGVIATDIDYHLPLIGKKNYLGMIPNPVNIDKIIYTSPSIKEKVIIFHGINSMSYDKKGNRFFEEALINLQQKHSDKIKVIQVRDIPYDEYIKLYSECHILLDQVYAYDQGYNALEAMAAGKVVFTGAEQEWLDYYNLKEDTVAINSLPDADAIFNKLEWLVLNPEKIIEISKNARAFIKKEHDYTDIAQKYLDTWEANN